MNKLFKPKMTGGTKQEAQNISPEAHNEWMDKGGKHSVGLKEGPADLSEREELGLVKNSKSEKRGMNVKSPKPESKMNPFSLTKKAGKSVAKASGKNKVMSKLAKKTAKE